MDGTKKQRSRGMVKKLPPHTWEPNRQGGEIQKQFLVILIVVMAFVVLSLLLFFGAKFVGKAYEFAGSEVNVEVQNGKIAVTATVPEGKKVSGVYFELTATTPNTNLCDLIGSINNVENKLFNGDFKYIECTDDKLYFADATLNDDNFKSGTFTIAEITLGTSVAQLTVLLNPVDIYDSVTGRDLFPTVTPTSPSQTFTLNFGECTPGATKECGVDTGECAKGTQTCQNNGAWGICRDEIVSVDETCDGLDNDCDDENIETDEREVCNTNENCGTFGNACAENQECIDGSCTEVSQCSLANLEVCTEGECDLLERASWIDGVCSIARNDCDLEHLDMCTEENCRALDALWLNEQCSARCTPASCQDGETCNSDTGLCEVPTPVRCTEASCGEGAVCNLVTGLCETLTVAPAAGGGGGGGGGCVFKYACGTWSICNSTMQQQRTCLDQSRCGRLPRVEVQSCATCQESWVCSLWSNCWNGIQTRTCTDQRQCGTIKLKPDFQRSCGEITPPPQPQIATPPPVVRAPLAPPVQQPAPIPLSFWQKYKSMLIAAQFGLLVVLAIVLVVLHLVKSHRPALNMEDLKRWVAEEKKMGTSDAGIRQHLRGTEWTRSEIEAALSSSG